MSSFPAASGTSPADNHLPSTAMTPVERRASASLAGIFALRMLGLFLVLPVFAIEARKYPGGDDAARIGLAMGIYGLTQAFLQLPLGMASDQWGRKRVIVAGLAVFALGSFLAAFATSLNGLLLARALQGAGAVSAAVTALLADQTRDVVRTKAMALVGASIGLMFAVSLVAAPLLVAAFGLSGLFAITGVMAIGGIAVVLRLVPPEPLLHVDRGVARAGLASVLRHPVLMRLNAGVFVLHTVQMAMWVAVPAMLLDAGLPKAEHWWIYLPAVLASFGVMGSTLFPLERRGYLRGVLLTAIAGLLLVQTGLWATAHWHGGLWALGLTLFVFFCSFNVLEASQPSLVSRLAPASLRGAALGVYNTMQSVGLFAGGALGGLVVKLAGAPTLFVTTSVLCLLWLAASRGLPALQAQDRA